MASSCKLPIFPWCPLQNPHRRYLQNPFKCNVNGQSSATREVKLAIKKTALRQPKDVNGGVLAAVHGGFLSSFSLGAFATQLNLILPGFQSFSIACHGNSVVLSLCYSSPPLSHSSPHYSHLTTCCSFLCWFLCLQCLRATTKTPQETLNESFFLMVGTFAPLCNNKPLRYIM